jgi:hypothetical protein
MHNEHAASGIGEGAVASYGISVCREPLRNFQITSQSLKAYQT